MAQETKRQPTVSLPRVMDHQRAVVLSPARFKVIVCGRRWGKTAIGLMMTLRGHGSFKGQRRGAIDGGNIWWIAPSYKVASKIWRDLKRATRDAWTDKSEVERRIELPGGGSVTVWSADDPGSLVGDGLDGVVIDEAAKVHRDAWGESVRPALADRLGWAVMIGTPKGQNWFHECFQIAGADQTGEWERWQRPTSDNPIITTTEIDAMRATMSGAKVAQELDAKFITTVGELFPRNKIEIVEQAPAMLRKPVRYWDKAGSELESGDWTVGVMIGKHDGLFYVLDVVRGRWNPFERNKVIKQTCELDDERWKRGGWSLWIEKTIGDGKESAMISGRELVKFAPRFHPETKSKIDRADHFAAAWQGGNVRLVRGNWNALYIDELASFPDDDIHDDQVDASTGAFNKLVLSGQGTGGGGMPVGLTAR